MKLAVAILNYNGEHLLRQFLPSVVQFTPYDVFIIDNGSSDGSLDLLKTKFPSVKTIELDKNYGFADGYNKGLQNIEADYFMLLNDDVEVTEHWLEPLIDLLDRDAQCAACQPKLKSFLSKKDFEYAGAAGGELDYLGYPFCRGRIFTSLEEDNNQYQEAEIFWATGAALLIRSELFKKFSFDPLFFAHQEEIDLCFRLRTSGYSIRCVTSSVCYHLGGGTLNKSSFRKTFLNFRNNHLMLYKNYPAKQYRKIFIIRLALDLLAAATFLLSGKFKETKAVICGIKAFLSLKKQYKSSLNRPQALPDQIYPHSILFQYHIRRRKHYSELSVSSKK
ncbi:MAG: glycosyltransferase family 2 protein [Bacteroidales bacterium]|jgi:GT2 family glycosyltransferase|nr:glycosyltransferase family 2 protein [Bacteroidales bacterium]